MKLEPSAALPHMLLVVFFDEMKTLQNQKREGRSFFLCVLLKERKEEEECMRTQEGPPYMHVTLFNKIFSPLSLPLTKYTRPVEERLYCLPRSTISTMKN